MGMVPPCASTHRASIKPVLTGLQYIVRKPSAIFRHSRFSLRRPRTSPIVIPANALFVIPDVFNRGSRVFSLSFIPLDAGSESGMTTGTCGIS